MSQYQDQDRRLGELRLPGSRDAGTSKNDIDLTAAGTTSNATTRSPSIAEQITAGTRFFDLRLATHNEQVVAHHTTAGQGACSATSVDDVLKDASTFCLNHVRQDPGRDHPRRRPRAHLRRKEVRDRPEERHRGQGPVGREDYAVKEGSFFRRKPPVMYSTLPVRNYPLPNIFSDDFVNEEVNKVIIATNDKGLQAVEDDDA